MRHSQGCAEWLGRCQAGRETETAMPRGGKTGPDEAAGEDGGLHATEASVCR